MLSRIAWLAVLFSTTTAAQFWSLSSTSDGSSVYFISTLRLKGTDEPLNGKVFVANGNRVSLVQSRERASVPSDAKPCSIAGFQDYLGVETSNSGTVAFVYQEDRKTCSYPPYPVSTQIATRTGESNVSGLVRLSAAGRYAVVYQPVTARMSDGIQVSFLDLVTGTTIPVDVPQPISSFEYTVLANSGGRVIANDGTASLAIGGSGNGRGLILKPGAEPRPFPSRMHFLWC